MVQIEQWKLVFYPKINRYQLFDLKADSHELNDLIKVKSHKARVVVMRQSLSNWFTQQGDGMFRSLE